MKRICSQGLIRGWTAWQEQWETAARQKRMLAAAVAHWRGEWEAALTLTLTQTVAQTLTLFLTLTLTLTLTRTRTS